MFKMKLCVLGLGHSTCIKNENRYVPSGLLGYINAQVVRIETVNYDLLRVAHPCVFVLCCARHHSCKVVKSSAMVIV